MSLSVISRRRIRAIVTMSLRWLTRTMCQIASKSDPFSLARATPSEGAKTGVAEPHIAEQSMPVSNGFGSRNFGIIVHSITVGSIPLARSAARARRPFDRPPSLCVRS